MHNVDEANKAIQMQQNIHETSIELKALTSSIKYVKCVSSTTFLYIFNCYMSCRIIYLRRQELDMQRQNNEHAKTEKSLALLEEECTGVTTDVARSATKQAQVRKAFAYIETD